MKLPTNGSISELEINLQVIYKVTQQKFSKYILPAIGNLKLSDIKSPVILKLCRPIEIKEFIETSQRVRAVIEQVFSFRLV